MTISRLCLSLLACAVCGAGEAGPPPQPGPPGGPPGHRGPSPEEMFKAADVDADGQVTHAEFLAQFEKRRQEERGKVFELMDANHDGSVSKEEFATFEPPAPPEGKEGRPGKPRRPGPDPEEMFKRFDRNGDGLITSDELGRKHDGERGRGGDGERGKGERDDGPRPLPPVAP